MKAIGSVRTNDSAVCEVAWWADNTAALGMRKVFWRTPAQEAHS